MAPQNIDPNTDRYHYGTLGTAQDEPDDPNPHKVLEYTDEAGDPQVYKLYEARVIHIKVQGHWISVHVVLGAYRRWYDSPPIWYGDPGEGEPDIILHDGLQARIRKEGRKER